MTEGLYLGALANFVDEAFSGLYRYDPDDFLEGDEFRLEIFDARKPDTVHAQKKFKARSDLIQQIRSDFEGAEDQSESEMEIDPELLGESALPLEITAERIAKKVCKVGTAFSHEAIPLVEGGGPGIATSANNQTNCQHPE